MKTDVDSIELRFSKRYAWVSQPETPSICDADERGKHGVYLWTVVTDHGEFALDVGEVGGGRDRSFVIRMREHLNGQLSGMFRIFDPEALLRWREPRHTPIWEGRGGPVKGNADSEFIERLPSMAPELVRFTKMIRFRLAPLESDRVTRRRAEAAIFHKLGEQENPAGSILPSGGYRPRSNEDAPLRLRIAIDDGPIEGLADGDTLKA